MIYLLIFTLVCLTLLVALCILLGFRLGGQPWISEAQRVRAEAAAAERQLHDLTRSAFMAMAEQAEKKRQWFSGTQSPAALARHFNVSVAAIEVRLHQTGLVGPTTRCLPPRADLKRLRPERSADSSFRYERRAPLLIT